MTMGLMFIFSQIRTCFDGIFGFYYKEIICLLVRATYFLIIFSSQVIVDCILRYKTLIGRILILPKKEKKVISYKTK